jgi:hypothetical protein
MTRRFTAVFTALTFVLASFAPAQAALREKQCNDPGLSIPIQASSPDQGSFVGILTIEKFARSGNSVIAVGTVTGTLTDETGALTGIVRTVSLPLQLPAPTTAATGAAAAAVTPQLVCDILHLVLGPLHLDLLGLIIDLNEVHLDITADPLGGLLGSLLCSLAGLLSGPLDGLLNQLVDILNQIIGIIG